MKLSHAVSFVCGAAAAMIAFTTIGGHVYELRMYHVNAGKMDALKARFRDYVPPALVSGMRKMLVSSGIDEDDIRTDEFAGYQCGNGFGIGSSCSRLTIC